MLTFKTASRDAAEMKTAKDELNGIFLEAVRSGKNTYNPKGVSALEANKWDIAELIVQIISDEVAATDPVPFFFEEMSANLSDKHVFQELNASLRVTRRAYGSKPLSQRLTFKEYSMTTSQKEINVEMPLEEIAGGRITPSQIAEEMAFTVNRYRIGAALEALDAGVPAVADRSGVAGSALRYTGMTKPNLDLAINGLMDEGATPTIMARHVALYPALPGFAGWSQDTTREFETRGQIGVYAGARIVVLKDSTSARVPTHIIPRTKIYLGSGKRGGKMLSRDVSFLNYAETSARLASFATGLRFEDGFLVHDPYQYRIITTS